MTVQDLRVRLHKLENDPRLTQSEREYIRASTLGVLVMRPRTVGEAKKYIGALERAINSAVTEIPL